MDNYNFMLTGVTPLLMHFNNLEARDAVQAKGRTGGKAGDDRHPADTWKSYLYVADGVVAMPSENLLSALIGVGSSIVIGRPKTLKRPIASLLFDKFYLDLSVHGKKVTTKQIDEIDGAFPKQQEGAKEVGISLFVKPASVNGKSHVRVRPRFDAWSIAGSFEVDDPELTEERLSRLFDAAGRAGIGDWRPSSPKKPGPFGRYTAEIEKS